jgi:hypothetical protein
VTNLSYTADKKRVKLTLLRLKVFRENSKKWYNSPKSGGVSKMMVPRESLSRYLSNEYQCFNRVIKLPIFFGILILVTKVDLRPWRVKHKHIHNIIC